MIERSSDCALPEGGGRSGGDYDPPMSDEPRNRGIRRAPSEGDVVPARKRAQREETDEFPSEEDIERFNNVTRTCPECNKEVFDDAALCYHCGHAFERTTEGSTANKKWVVAVVVVIIAAFAVLALRGLM